MKDTVLADLNQYKRVANGNSKVKHHKFSFMIPSGLTSPQIITKSKPHIFDVLGKLYELDGELVVFGAVSGEPRRVSFSYRPKKLIIEVPEEYSRTLYSSKKRDSTSKNKLGDGLKKVGRGIGNWLDSLDVNGLNNMFDEPSKSSNRRTVSRKTGRTKNGGE